MSGIRKGDTVGESPDDRQQSGSAPLVGRAREVQLECMLRVIVGGMRAAHRLDEMRGDITIWS